MKTKAIIVALLTGLIMTGFTVKVNNQPKERIVPDVAKNKKNAVKSDAQTIATGKALWNIHCKSCHGAKGLGDGSKASQLNTEPGDFSKPVLQTQTDGSLFYKISEGRKDMPAYKKKIADEDDRWSVVNFMKTLKK